MNLTLDLDGAHVSSVGNFRARTDEQHEFVGCSRELHGRHACSLASGKALRNDLRHSIQSPQSGRTEIVSASGIRVVAVEVKIVVKLATGYGTTDLGCCNCHCDSPFY